MRRAYSLKNVTSTFTATTEWGAASGGYYTITITHNFNTLNVIAQVWADDNILTSYEMATPTVNTLTLKVTEVPDNRFAGKVVIIAV